MKYVKNLLAVIVAVAMLLFGGSALAAVNTLTLPEALRIIEKEAFYGDTSIDKVVLPEGTTEIGARAFANSTLTEINLPESLTFIAEDAFEACEALTLLVEKNSSYAHTFAEEKGIPYRLKTTHAEDFTYSYQDDAYCTITGYTGTDTALCLPEKSPDGHIVRAVGSFAFSDCSGLTSVVLPKGLESIASCAFCDCSGLTSVVFPEGLESIGDQAFLDCSGLTSLALPAGLRSMGWQTFGRCSGLTSVVLPEGLMNIGKYAFWGCSGLTSVVLPKGLESIAGGAFCDCSGLTSVFFPKGLKSIGYNAFWGCSGLTSMYIPEGLESIEEWAFYECSGLRSVVLPEGIESIEEYAFNDCSSLTNINLPESVTSIGGHAFGGCRSLTIFGVLGSYAETYAKANGISFTYVDKPIMLPEVPEGLYCEIIYTYSIDGKFYHEADLLKEYNGVSAGTEYYGRHIFLDAKGRVVTDADTLCKLFTLSLYASSENTILQGLKDMGTASQTWTDVALDYLKDEQLVNFLGNGFGAAVKSFTSGNPSGLLEMAKYTTDMGNIIAWSMIANIKLLTNHLWEMIDLSLNYSTKNAAGYYNYDRVVMMLEYYRYCSLYYDAAQSLCMPVVDDILAKFDSDLEVGLNRLISMAQSFAETMVPGADEVPGLGALVKVCNAIIDGDVGEQQILGTLFTFITKDPMSMSVNAMTGSIMALCNVVNIDPNAHDEFIGAFYMTTEEMINCPLYSYQLRLAQ